MFRAISLCSGIEAATVAQRAARLPWTWEAYSEVAAFPSRVLAHHYPETPNVGDMTMADWSKYRGANLVIAGTPCQAFSVAGARQGLKDSRGRLTQTFVEAVDLINPDFVVWENVPGVLSDKTNAFGCLLGGLAGEDAELVPPGKKWPNAGIVFGPTRNVAWRIVDAQYYGLAQRRRRVLIVGCPVGGCDPFEILFEPESMRRHSAPSRETRPSVAGRVDAGAYGGIAPTLTANGKAAGSATQQDAENGMLIAHTLEATAGRSGGAGTPIGLIVVSALTRSGVGVGGPDENQARAGRLVVSAFGGNDTRGPIDVATARNASGSPSNRLDFESETFLVHAFDAGQGVRRLLPVECERLQGFPDGYTDIPIGSKRAADGPRYQAIGNSMAVTKIKWLFERIHVAHVSRQIEKLIA